MLCDAHNILFEETIQSGNARKIMGCWVKAKGGAEKASEAITGLKREE